MPLLLLLWMLQLMLLLLSAVVLMPVGSWWWFLVVSGGSWWFLLVLGQWYVNLRLCSRSVLCGVNSFGQGFVLLFLFLPRKSFNCFCFL